MYREREREREGEREREREREREQEFHVSVRVFFLLFLVRRSCMSLGAIVSSFAHVQLDITMGE